MVEEGSKGMFSALNSARSRLEYSMTICPRCGIRHQGYGNCVQCGMPVVDETAFAVPQPTQNGMVSQQYHHPAQNRPISQQYQQYVQPAYIPSQVASQQAGLSCKRCGSQNVTVQVMQVAGKTKRKGNGFSGHANNFFRIITIICTVGLAAIFWKKSEGVNQTKYVNQKVAVCQTCGSSWNIK